MTGEIHAGDDHQRLKDDKAAADAAMSPWVADEFNSIGRKSRLAVDIERRKTSTVAWVTGPDVGRGQEVIRLLSMKERQKRGQEQGGQANARAPTGHNNPLCEAAATEPDRKSLRTALSVPGHDNPATRVGHSGKSTVGVVEIKRPLPDRPTPPYPGPVGSRPSYAGDLPGQAPGMTPALPNSSTPEVGVCCTAWTGRGQAIDLVH